MAKINLTKSQQDALVEVNTKLGQLSNLNTMLSEIGAFQILLVNESEEVAKVLLPAMYDKKLVMILKRYQKALLTNIQSRVRVNRIELSDAEKSILDEAINGKSEVIEEFVPETSEEK